ncbi:hypothetical protein DMC30DRAFT_69927 [Rhodotorula diobovata]|uniref:Uncharacterized protein n=1 Tax=Rhodotorula diobovata TaxID=5288 RepID=A0A5C5FMY0_9BASI|nr:hypothetical protein DMC30DRAFT_69927 [Rhodotorula diobovata]
MPHQGVRIELVKVEVERADGTVKRWSVGLTDTSGQRRSLEDVKREVATLIHPSLASFTLVCASPSPLLGCGVTASCWEAVEDGDVLRVELDEPVSLVAGGQEARGLAAETDGRERAGGARSEGQLDLNLVTKSSLAVPSSPDCIPTPISSSSNTDDGSSNLSAAVAATSSPRSTTDTFATPSDSPQLPLSPPHSLPASRRSSLAFDAHGTMLSTSVITATSSPRGPGSSRSRSSTPGRQPRTAETSPEESPKPYSQLGHVFESLNRQFGHQMRMQSASGTRSPRQGSGHSSRAASTAPTSPVLVISPGLLEHKASFEHALQAKLGVEASVRPSRSTTSLSSRRASPSSSPGSSRPVSPARALLPSIPSLSMTQRPSSPRYPPAPTSATSAGVPVADGSRSTSRSRAAAVRFVSDADSTRPPTPAKTPYTTPPTTPGVCVPTAQAPWVPLRESPNSSALRSP